jgi:hypothetical protein
MDWPNFATVEMNEKSSGNKPNTVLDEWTKNHLRGHQMRCKRRITYTPQTPWKKEKTATRLHALEEPESGSRSMGTPKTKAAVSDAENVWGGGERGGCTCVMRARSMGCKL